MLRAKNRQGSNHEYATLGTVVIRPCGGDWHSRLRDVGGRVLNTQEPQMTPPSPFWFETQTSRERKRRLKLFPKLVDALEATVKQASHVRFESRAEDFAEHPKYCFRCKAEELLREARKES